MGKGDKKTTKGKIIMGSYGKKRPRVKSKNVEAVVAEKKEKVAVPKEEKPKKEKATEKKAK